MIKCPNCQHTEPDGAVFCSDCGAQLVFLDTINTQVIQADGMDGLPTGGVTAPMPPLPAETTYWATLHLLESGHLFPLTERAEYTLGRISEGQTIMPDIDLSPFKAYDNGVSRLHAVIRLVKGKPAIMDLGSANGTYLNGVRLTPNVEQPLIHGDTVSLGKLKIQVLLA
jgi:hypothetical protein